LVIVGTVIGAIVVNEAVLLAQPVPAELVA
jgi:hypothetical protein